MNERTGWWFTVLVGGPDPSQNAAIRTYSISTGEDVHGRTFARAYPEFNNGILRPFSSFLQTGFSKDARERFRIGTAEDGETLTSKSATQPTQTDDNNIKDTKALTHIPVTGAETPTLPPSTVAKLPPVVNAAAASTVGITGIAAETPTQLPSTVAELPPVVDAQTAFSINEPKLPSTVNDVPLITNVAATSTGGIADAHQEIKEPEFLPLQPFQIQPLQTPLQGVDGVAAGVPPFPLYYKPTNQDWNRMSGVAPGETEYHFGVQGFDDGFLGHLGSGVHGYNMLTGPAQEAWLSAQNPAGTASLEINNWDFGQYPSGVATNMPRPTYHPLPMPESNIGQPEELGSQIRKPTGRKEVVPLTEVVNNICKYAKQQIEQYL